MQEINQLLIDFRDARKWQKHHTGPELARSLMIEAAELNRLFQWPLMGRPIDKNDLADELADIAIYSRYLCMMFDINMDEAVRDKIVKNGKKYPVDHPPQR